MGGGPPIRDGGNLNSMGPPKSCGMDGESRSERSILHHPNRSSTSTVSEVHSGPVLRPMDIHQGDETHNGSVESPGHPNNHLHT